MNVRRKRETKSGQVSRKTEQTALVHVLYSTSDHEALSLGTDNGVHSTLACGPLIDGNGIKVSSHKDCCADFRNVAFRRAADSFRRYEVAHRA